MEGRRKLLSILVIISFVHSISNESQDEEEGINLSNVSDENLATEIRRRGLNGPWSSDEAASILNMAADVMREDFKVVRHRKFLSEAKFLSQLLTNEIEPIIYTEPEGDKEDYFDDPIIVDGREIRASTMRKIVDMYEGRNGQSQRSEESMTKLYHWFRRWMVPRFKKRLETVNRFDRLKMLDRHVYLQFEDARSKKQPVHGRMIQRWARQFASNGSLLPDFIASDSWLHRFKRRNGIVSRKVTVYTDRSASDENVIRERIRDFKSNYTEESSQFGQSCIWNFDQTDFNYEPANLRTLSHKGERDTLLMLKSKNKHSHSYSVQPIISRDGRLFDKLLIVTQETKDSFGPQIGPKIDALERKFGNIEVYATKSGKLTTELMNKWFNGTFKKAVDRVKCHHPELGDEAVLVLADSWGGHSSRDQKDLLHSMGAKMLQIPRKTTDKLQPLGINFNRQLKIFYNRVIEEAFYEDLMANVASREGILNLQSLIHDQLTSKKYNDMIRYAWHSTDPSFNNSELANHPPPMVNAIQFDFDQSAKCSISGCTNHAFTRCSHCGKFLCLNHFLQRECFHRQTLSRARRNIDECLVGEECGPTIEEPKNEAVSVAQLKPNTTDLGTATAFAQGLPMVIAAGGLLVNHMLAQTKPTMPPNEALGSSETTPFEFPETLDFVSEGESRGTARPSTTVMPNRSTSTRRSHVTSSKKPSAPKTPSRRRGGRGRGS